MGDVIITAYLGSKQSGFIEPNHIKFPRIVVSAAWIIISTQNCNELAKNLI